MAMQKMIKKKTKKPKSDGVFPYDIIENILSRLPVKPLVRFRCVSKEWCKLLQNPHFVNMHLIRSKEKKNEFKLVLGNSGLCSIDYMSPRLHLNITQPPDIMKEVKNSWSEFVMTSFGAFSMDCDFHYLGSKSNCLLKMVNCMAEVFGSCNGILCLIPDFETIVLWNPSTRQRRILPDIPYEFLPLAQISECSSGYGFGYNALSMDYEVVSVTSIVEEYNDNDPSIDDEDTNNHPSIVSVYSLARNSWKKLHDIPYKISDKEPGELISGQLYWVAAHCSRKYTCVIAFDLNETKFQEVSIPEYEKEDFHMMNVAALDEKLGLIYTYRTHYQAWVMKEYELKKSWVKLFKIEQKHSVRSLEPLFSTKDGAIIMVKNYTDIVLYQMKDKRLTTLITTDDRKAGFRAKTYIESLVSLDVHNGAVVRSAEWLQQQEKPQTKQRSHFASAVSRTKESLHRERCLAYLECFY